MNIARHLAAIRSKGVSVRVYLLGFVAAILVPALLFGGWLTLRYADAERALIIRNSENKASQVVADIDDDIAAAKATLIALAGSQFLKANDLENLHRQFIDVSKPLGAQFVLRDGPTGRQIINSAIAPGQPLPQSNSPQALAAMQEAIRTGGPTISNVFFSEPLKQFVVNVGIPIKQTAGTAYFLSIGVPVRTFGDSLQNAALPGQWVVSLVDADKTIIARSDRKDELIGSKVANADLVTRAMQDGFVIGKNRDGIPFRSVAHRSETTGWYAFVGVPLAELQAPARDALFRYALASAAAFVLVMSLSLAFGDRVSQLFGEMGIDRKPTRDEFRTLFESAPNGVLVVDDKGLIVLANENIERQYGYQRGELVGKAVALLVPDRFRGTHPLLQHSFNAAPEFQSIDNGRELFGRRKDGSEFPTEIGINPIATRNGDFIMATVIDITMRIQSEKRLLTALAERDDLRRRFMQAQEGERLRLAHELHDQTGQALTAALLEIKDLESQLKDDGRNRARTLRKSMEQMGKTLHRVAWELRPASIDELGLTSALSDYIPEWSRQYGIEADFLCRDPHLDSIAEEKRTAIYRIVQEALTNVAKHARGVTSVSVVVDRTDSILQLTIEDDGDGFDLAEIEAGRKRSGGLGIAGVRERLALIGGELEIETSRGAGTAIFARIPLHDERVIA